MLSHVDKNGQANMVDVSEKATTTREARASASISMSPEAFALLSSNTNKKGDVLQVARIAGIQAAKQCSNLIPLCHPLMLTKVGVDFTLDEKACRVDIETLAKLVGQTGVEMEALTAASVAALTVFDMCKAADPHMVISDIKVLEKRGGKSDHSISNGSVSNGSVSSASTSNQGK